MTKHSFIFCVLFLCFFLCFFVVVKKLICKTANQIKYGFLFSCFYFVVVVVAAVVFFVFLCFFFQTGSIFILFFIHTVGKSAGCVPNAAVCESIRLLLLSVKHPISFTTWHWFAIVTATGRKARTKDFISKLIPVAMPRAITNTRIPLHQSIFYT